MTSLYGFIKRVLAIVSPPTCQLSTASTPIRFGILGAATIAPPALILPARSHPEVVVYAIAARSLEKAQKFAAKNGVEKVYGGPNAYQELLDDPNVDAVYNPLPNGLHHEWTMKALAAGKHVLLEKPSADRAAETREMFEFADQKGLVLLEAFHNRFHPALLRAKAILDSGELGALKHVDVRMTLSRGIMKDDDIRFNFELGGGAMMDMGCYAMHCLRYFTSSNPTSVASATPEINPSRSDKPSLIDAGMKAELTFPKDMTGSLFCHLRNPPMLKIIPRVPEFFVTATCEGGELRMYNFIMPAFYHYIEVIVKSGNGEKKRVEKVYKPTEQGWKAEDWWSSYHHQLVAFVDKIKGREPKAWVTAEDSVQNMEWIERVYEKSGLGLRPASTFKLPVL